MSPRLDAAGQLIWREYEWIIGEAIARQPRTLQRAIGPSELGTDCDLCLGRKLAGIPERAEFGWLPYVGTCVHTGLADTFTNWRGPAQTDGDRPRFIVEQRVDVGDVDGKRITGSADLYDRDTYTVSDWKIVGAATLKSAHVNGAKPAYAVQRQLYGRGFVRAGLRVDWVQVIYLPRNEPTLANAIVDRVPFDESVAVAALERASRLAAAIRLAGADAILPHLPAAPGCYDCSRYPDAAGVYPPKPGRHPDRLSELIA